MRRYGGIALACIGLLAGASAGFAARSSTELQPGTVAAASAELAPESGYYLRVEPARVTRDHGREQLTIASRVGTTKQAKTRSIASVQIEDDRGNVVEPARVTPRIDLAPASELAGLEVALPALSDGWYRVRAQAVFVDPASPQETLGSETDSLYLEVRDGEIFIVDMAAWFAGSNANLGRAS